MDLGEINKSNWVSVHFLAFLEGESRWGILFESEGLVLAYCANATCTDLTPLLGQFVIRQLGNRNAMPSRCEKKSHPREVTHERGLSRTQLAALKNLHCQQETAALLQGRWS